MLPDITNVVKVDSILNSSFLGILFQIVLELKKVITEFSFSSTGNYRHHPI
jgi:hypothetical protein